MKNAYEIKGAGGGGGGGSSGKGGGSSRPPVEAANTLRSKDYINVVAILGEGEWEGFVREDPLESIYLDEVPIKNPDGTLNFREFGIDYRLGTPGQTGFPWIVTVDEEIAVGVEIRNDTPVVRTISDTDVDFVRIILGVNQFQEVEEGTGDINGVSVDYAIDISSAGGPYVTVHTGTIAGKTSGQYQRQLDWWLTTTGPWNIRLRRLTPDSESTRIQDKIYWSSYVEQKSNASNYPNTVTVYTQFSSEYFNSKPETTLLMRGLKVRVPHNYDLATNSYSGVFNGTLVTNYSENPVWCLYDLLTNDRYGLGLPEEQLDVYSFYEAGVYCDGWVTNGLGGAEPRYRIGAYIQNTGNAFDIVKAILSNFQGQLYYENGTLVLSQDRPKTASYIFSPANVVTEYDDSGNLTRPPFEYDHTDPSTRYNSVLVSYDDINDFCNTTTELVEDATDIATYGYNPTEVTAFGCTSRGQAHRLGRWILFSSIYQTETVTFQVGSDGLYVQPGDVVLIQDPSRTTQRLAGRVVSANSTSVTLDKAVEIVAGKSYWLITMNSNREVVNAVVATSGLDGTTSVINIVGSYASENIPAPDSYWVLRVIGEEDGKDYQILNITEEGDYKYTITAVEYFAEKYDFLEAINFSNVDFNLGAALGIPLPPTGLRVSEALYSGSGSAGVNVKINFLWAGTVSPGLRRYEVGYKKATDVEWTEFITTNTNYAFFDFTPGLYDFRVRTVNVAETTSEYAVIQQEIYGLTTPPADITNFRIKKEGADFARLSWDLPTDLDVLQGGRLIIKHTYLDGGATWNNGIVIAEIPGNTTNYLSPFLNGCYMIKAEDSSGNRSPNAAFVYTSLDWFEEFNYVLNLAESDNLYPGTKTTVYYDETLEGLKIEPQSFVDNFVGNWDDLVGDFDSLFDEGLVMPSGIYEFSDEFDLGATYPARVFLRINTEVIDELTLWDSFQGNFDDLGNIFDLQNNEGAFVTPQIALSQDGVTYADWQNLENYGEFVARKYKFRLQMNSVEASKNVLVKSLEVILDMADRTESGSVTTSNLGDTSIVYGTPFYNVPQLFANIQNGQEGDAIIVTAQSSTGFSFHIANSGVRVIREVDWFAKGYGRLVA